MSEILETPETPETLENKGNDNEIINVGKSNTNEIIDDIEKDFEKFNQANSDYKPDEQQSDANTIDPTEIDLSQAENFKLQIFISLMFTLLDGLHVFIYGFMSKYKITREDIGLDETDKQGLEIYFKTQRVMDLINRLPVEVIGFLHIEYMYFNKFQEFNKRMKEIEPEEEEQEEEEQEEQEEEEQEEQETTEDKIQKIFDKKKQEFESQKKDIDNSASVGTDNKNVSKKAAPKKAAPKKTAPKKAATKKVEVKKAAPKKAATKKTTEDKK